MSNWGANSEDVSDDGVVQEEDQSIKSVKEAEFWGDEQPQIEQVTNQLDSSSDNIKVAVRVRPPNTRCLTYD